MPEVRHCQARQHSDQMICSHCSLIWDMNDPEPPVCREVPADPTASTRPNPAHGAPKPKNHNPVA